VVYEGSREAITIGRGKIEAFRRDLDDDGRAEIIVADHAGMSNGMGVEYWNLTIIDGRSGASIVTPLVEYGDGVIQRRTILVTAWEWMGGHLYFVARPYLYANGTLRPDKARGMWRRRYLFSFQRERNAGGSPRQWLKRASHVAWSDP
jgi:hypothetical protein